MHGNEIDILCELALLEIPAQRKERLVAGIDQMIGYFRVLEEFKEETPPHNDTAGGRTENRLRPDEPQRPFGDANLLESAPYARRGFFLVPHVL